MADMVGKSKVIGEASTKAPVRERSADDIVERLRAHEPTGRRAMGGGSLACDATGKVIEAKMWGGEMITRLRNPDGPEAADYISRLRGEVEDWKARWERAAADVAELVLRVDPEVATLRERVKELEDGLKRANDHLDAWARDHSMEATAETWAILHCNASLLTNQEQG